MNNSVYNFLRNFFIKTKKDNQRTIHNSLYPSDWSDEQILNSLAKLWLDNTIPEYQLTNELKLKEGVIDYVNQIVIVENGKIIVGFPVNTNEQGGVAGCDFKLFKTLVENQSKLTPEQFRYAKLCLSSREPTIAERCLSSWL
jgi:hypothetical protein